MKQIGHFFSGAFRAFIEGDAWVRLSALLWGASCIARRQFMKGVLLICEQALLLWGFFGLLWPYLMKFGTLGTVQAEPAIAAVVAQTEFADVQRVGSKYWDPAAALGKIVVNGNPDGADLQTLLDNAVAGITAPADQ